MSYALTEFNGVLLPDRMPEDDLSTGMAESSLLDSIGGAFDYWQMVQRPPRKRTIPFRGIYTGETTYLVDEAGNYIVDEAGNYIIAGDAENRLRAQVGALLAQQGRRGSLWREREDGARQWLTARLQSVNYIRKVDDAYTANIDCQFETLHAAWRAETATQKSVSASNGVAAGLTVSNGGDVTVQDAVITVAVTSGTMTQLDIDGTGIDLTWAGSLASGNTLEINCAAQSVARTDGTDQYSGFVLNSGHTARGWLPLEQGITLLVVTVMGGDATVTVTHYNQFR